MLHYATKGTAKNLYSCPDRCWVPLVRVAAARVSTYPHYILKAGLARSRDLAKIVLISGNSVCHRALADRRSSRRMYTGMHIRWIMTKNRSITPRMLSRSNLRPYAAIGGSRLQDHLPLPDRFRR